MTDEKWTKVKAKLDQDQGALLDQLREDYTEASRLHVPGYKGGPNPGILAELIRMGWRKPSDA